MKKILVFVFSAVFLLLVIMNFLNDSKIVSNGGDTNTTIIIDHPNKSEEGISATVTLDNKNGERKEKIVGDGNVSESLQKNVAEGSENKKSVSGFLPKKQRVPGNFGSPPLPIMEGVNKKTQGNTPPSF